MEIFHVFEYYEKIEIITVSKSLSIETSMCEFDRVMTSDYNDVDDDDDDDVDDDGWALYQLEEKEKDRLRLLREEVLILYIQNVDWDEIREKLDDKTPYWSTSKWEELREWADRKRSEEAQIREWEKKQEWEWANPLCHPSPLEETVSELEFLQPTRRAGGRHLPCSVCE